MELPVIALLTIICSVDAFSKQRCLYYDRQCVDHCPRWMHAYHTRCDGQTMSQRTCTNPLTYVIGFACGWSRCDCNSDKLLDEDTGHCVDMYDCPPVSLPRRSKYRTNRKKKPWRLPKRVRTQDIIDPAIEQIRG